ncbi:MAG: hypothetical protein KJP12_05175, partial [Acidimicrobiia bacterium]|nr:hypothetical protein [Acidimicrobiia bacterium]
MRRVVQLLLVVALLAGVLSTGSALAGPPEDPRSEHQRIVDFWTPNRVQQAVPRDFVLDEASGRLLPAAKGGNKPGGGGDKGDKGGGKGGGKGGDSSTVAGAPWDAGGEVLATTGKVLFELGGSYYVCSASIVDDAAASVSIVLTAAHCVYDNVGGGQFATNWVFIPAYDDTKPDLTTSGSFCDQTTYGCWTADALVLHDGFASAGGFNGSAIVHDFAFAVVGAGGKANVLPEDALGSHAIAFSSVSKNTPLYAFGYPQAASFNRDLTYCAGGAGFDSRLGKATYQLGCSMTGGASGGPWYGTFDESAGSGIATSVNSYRYSGGDAMYGPKFNSTTSA